MANIITVRNLDPGVKARIQDRARRHGRSMEAEIRAILAAVPVQDPAEEPHDFVWAVARYQESIVDLDSDVELVRPPAEPARGADLFQAAPT
ncbi:MAG: Arc family DNA-binding protein [Micrococcales bacterium]|nr:Arc family DNA-binding protein [Micrococcales bacterium]